MLKCLKEYDFIGEIQWCQCFYFNDQLSQNDHINQNATTLETCESPTFHGATTSAGTSDRD